MSHFPFYLNSTFPSSRVPLVFGAEGEGGPHRGLSLLCVHAVPCLLVLSRVNRISLTQVP